MTLDELTELWASETLRHPEVDPDHVAQVAVITVYTSPATVQYGLQQAFTGEWATWSCGYPMLELADAVQDATACGPIRWRAAVLRVDPAAGERTITFVYGPEAAALVDPRTAMEQLGTSGSADMRMVPGGGRHPA